MTFQSKRGIGPMCGRMQKWQRVVLTIVAIIIAVRIGYIFFGDEVDKEYVTSFSYDLTNAEMIPCNHISQSFIATESRLNSMEFFFHLDEQQEASVLLMKICLGSELIYQTKITVQQEDVDSWKKVFVNAQLRPGEEYTVSLEVEDVDARSLPEVPMVKSEAAPEVSVPYQYNNAIDGNYAFQYGYLGEPNILDKLTISSLWLILFVVTVLLLRQYSTIHSGVLRVLHGIEIQTGKFICICGIELLAAWIMIECSGIDLQGFTKIILTLISILAALDYEKKKKYIEKLLDQTWKKSLFVLLCLYAAFALVGQRLFIYPLDRKITAGGLAVFICAVIWFVPVMKSAFYRLNVWSVKWFDRSNSIRQWQFIVACIILLLLPAAYNLIANNPGISDVDTYEAFEKNAQNLYGMYNWHPAFYSIVLHKMQRIWNSTYMVILVQYCFWAYVQIELLLHLRKKGMADGVLLTFAFLSGMNAANLLFLNTIWKDVPYAYSVMWLFVIIAKLCGDSDYYRKRWFIYLELFIALIFIGLLRKNGIVPFIISMVSLIAVFRKNIKLIATYLAAILFMLYMTGPVYSHYQVIEPGRRGIYIGLGQDVLGAYYGGGEVSEDTLKMITVMTHHNNAEFDYNPTWAHQEYDLGVEPLYFVRAYIDTFLKNPILTSRTVVDRLDCIWDVFRGEDAIVQNTNFTDTEDGDRRWNEFYNERVFRSIYPGMSAATQRTVDLQWMDTVIWRCGLLTLAGMISLVWLVICRGRTRYILLYMPMIAQIMSLLLSTGWTDYRYFWPNNLLNFAVLPLVLLAVHKESLPSNE